jgi:hypothetical protein
VQKTEGNVVFHTARSTAYPQPEAGKGEGPVPLVVAPDELPLRLGLTTVSIRPLPGLATFSDTTLA